MEKLRIYQKALQLVKAVYSLIQANPQLQKDFSLSDQLKRASVSVVTNIAEGYRRTRRYTQSYLYIASGSTNELIALLDVVSAIFDIEVTSLQNDYKTLGKQIISFSKTIK